MSTTDELLEHGMLTFTDDVFERSVQDDVVIKPEWAAEAVPDLDEDVDGGAARPPASLGGRLAGAPGFGG